MILSLEYQACHFVHQVMVSVDAGGRLLLPPALACGQQAGQTPPARQLVKVVAFYIYLVPGTSAKTGVFGLAPKSMRKREKYYF